MIDTRSLPSIPYANPHVQSNSNDVGPSYIQSNYSNPESSYTTPGFSQADPYSLHSMATVPPIETPPFETPDKVLKILAMFGITDIESIETGPTLH